MQNYHALSTVYDTFMDNRDPRWPQYLLEILERKRVLPGAQVLDLACGTGAITIPLAQAGYRVTGADLSEEMLAVAAQASRRQKILVTFLQADMQAFSLLRQVDAINCACDPVNYLTPQGVERFFHCAYQALRPGGVLLFDISTRYHLETEIGCGSFSATTDDSAYICENWYENGVLEMGVTIFTRERQDLYRRDEEFHVLHAHPPARLMDGLKAAGFVEIAQYAFLTEEPPRPETSRIQFVAVK